MNAPEERPKTNGAATATAAAASLRTVKDYVGGRWVEPKVARWDEVKNPATGDVIVFNRNRDSIEVQQSNAIYNRQ